MMRAQTISAALLLTIAASAAARAESATPAVDKPNPSPPAGPWYGWQTGIADAAVLAMFVGGAVSNRDDQGGFYEIGTASYLLVPTTIHLAHGHVGRAFGRLALRFGAPLLGAVTGLVASYNCPREEYPESMFFSACQGDRAVIGMFVGMAAAALVDLATSRDDAPDSVPPARPNPDRNVAWSPVVAPSPAGATVGIVGRF